MNFVDLLGQSHAIKLGQMIIQDRSKGVLIAGPSGCGKKTYARIITEGLGGKGATYSDIPDTTYGEWSIICPTNPDRHEWGRLVGLMDENPKHSFIVVCGNLDTVPKGIQSRCVRVVLRPIPVADLVAYAENFLVRHEVPYDRHCLDLVVNACHGDIRELKSTLGLANVNGELDEKFLSKLTPTLPKLVNQIFEHLVDGYFPEAKQVAQEACQFYSPTQLVRALMNFYGWIWGESSPLGDRVKHRFPYIPRTTECLLRWVQVKTHTGDTLGPLLIEELNQTGISLEDPRVVEARRLKEEEKAQSLLKGRPELNLDPTSVSNRKNPHLPIYEDKSVPMDPRVRQTLKEEAEKAAKQTLKGGFNVPSSVISEEAMGDVNPFGVRMPPPKQVPPGVALPSAFVKRTKAKKLTPEEKWDLVYSEKDTRQGERAHIMTLVKDFSGRVMSESSQGMTLRVPKSSLDKFIAIGAVVC